MARGPEPRHSPAKKPHHAENGFSHSPARMDKRKAGNSNSDSGLSLSPPPDELIRLEDENLPPQKVQRLMDDISETIRESKAYVLALKKPDDIQRLLESKQLKSSQRLPLTLNGLGRVNTLAYRRNEFSRSKNKKKGRSKKTEPQDDQDSDSDSESAPDGEWEVEKIIDWGLDDDGQVVYRVRWKGWGENDDTWEPLSNLTNAGNAVNVFRDKREIQEKSKTRKILARLRLLVQKLMSDECDRGILFKLFGYKPDHVKDNMEKKESEFKKTLKAKSNLLLEYDAQKSDLSVNDVVELMLKQMKLQDDDELEQLQNLLKLADDRSVMLTELKKREFDLQLRVKAEGDKYTISIENLVDADVYPQFEYYKTYQFFDVDPPSGPVMYCSEERGSKHNCSSKGCGLDQGKCPCVKDSGKAPYNKEGALTLDAREPVYECNSKCICPDTCRFKVVSRGCKLSFCIFKTENRGWGLRSMQRIPKGQFITSYNGEVVSAKEKNKREKTQESWRTTYMFDLDYNPPADDDEEEEEVLAVDARFKGNLARFINHSCEPNLQINPVWNETPDRRIPIIAFFSTRVIQKGEELTIDYNARQSENIAEANPDWVHWIDPGELADPHYEDRLCRCGSQKCRGFVV